MNVTTILIKASRQNSHTRATNKPDERSIEYLLGFRRLCNDTSQSPQTAGHGLDRNWLTLYCIKERVSSPLLIFEKM